MIKRFFDVFVAGILLLISLPFLLLAMVCLSLESKGSGLFQQSRVGLGGDLFTIYKLRTMKLITEHNEEVTNEQRITRLGRFLRDTHLDELPQFWNVIRGDMSIVGPRPHLLHEHVANIAACPAYETRTSVRPGMIGLAQVLPKSQFGTAQYGDRIDAFYVTHQCMSLDLIALYRTLRLVCVGRK
jgi:lipopolysaccharide/colanic/teichoic acid biosynthesis glycosyltransferase